MIIRLKIWEYQEVMFTFDLFLSFYEIKSFGNMSDSYLTCVDTFELLSSPEYFTTKTRNPKHGTYEQVQVEVQAESHPKCK